MSSNGSSEGMHFSKDVKLGILHAGRALVWILSRVWAALEPFVWGAVIAYVLSPVVAWIESRTHLR